ncbi:flavin reductase family protein [Aminobacterium mobile]|jgi:ferric-chelate reductase [NAD(P)H]|uniref:flavin reductase family protein n=1 Tax=Aminobacterium mobile TaxID=81467 RepID=UPI0004640008|nr:flavin reductase family protein [Aminobacterium mobile]
MAESIDPRALFTVSYGVYILSTEWEEKKNGQIINAFMQLTGDPICVAACLHKDNYTTELLEKSRRFSLSVLEDATPLKFIGVFGFRCGRDFDKFNACSYTISESGLPVVTDYALASIEGEVLSVTDIFTHKLFIAQVRAATVLKEGKPLLYSDYHTIKKGKSPERAPSAVFNVIK